MPQTACTVLPRKTGQRQMCFHRSGPLKCRTFRSKRVSPSCGCPPCTRIQLAARARLSGSLSGPAGRHSPLPYRRLPSTTRISICRDRLRCCSPSSDRMIPTVCRSQSAWAVAARSGPANTGQPVWVAIRTASSPTSSGLVAAGHFARPSRDCHPGIPGTRFPLKCPKRAVEVPAIRPAASCLFRQHVRVTD